MKRALIAVSMLAALGGCGVLGGSDKPKTPTIGTRVPILTAETGIEVDPGLASLSVALPPAVQNDAWAQPGGNATKSVGHVALPASLSRAWSVNIGQGSSKRARLGAAPVVGGGRIYAVDAKDRKSTRLNSSHMSESRMPSSA